MFDKYALDLAIETCEEYEEKRAQGRIGILYHIFTCQNIKSAKFRQERSHEKVLRSLTHTKTR